MAKIWAMVLDIGADPTACCFEVRPYQTDGWNLLVTALSRGGNTHLLKVRVQLDGTLTLWEEADQDAIETHQFGAPLRQLAKQQNDAREARGKEWLRPKK